MDLLDLRPILSESEACSEAPWLGKTYSGQETMNDRQ